MVTHVLIPGRHQPSPPDNDQMFSLSKEYEGAKGHVFGGVDKRNPMQWVDIEAGPYTVCIDVGILRKERYHFECRHTEVGNEPVTMTFEIER